MGKLVRPMVGPRGGQASSVHRLVEDTQAAGLITSLSGESPTLKLFTNQTEPNGVAYLDPVLTINGASVTPSYRYKGGDATLTAGAGNGWAAWGYGEDLTYTANGATPPTINNGSPLLGTADDAVKFNGDGAGNGDFYTAQNATVGDITTEDFCFECIVTADTSSNYYFGKRTAVPDTGYRLMGNATGFRFRFRVAGATVDVIAGSATDAAWYHVMIFCNRDEASANGLQIYLNGAANGAGVNPAAAAGSLTNTDALELGNATSYADKTVDSSVAYIAMWKKAAWFAAGAGGQAECAAIAAERFAYLRGLYPSLAKGTALPTVMTRAFAAHVDKLESGNRKLYLVGSEWLRLVHRQDSAGTTIKGYLAEAQVENKCLQSETFGVTWAMEDAGDTVTANAIAAPNKMTVADSITADATNGQHGLSQAITVTAVTWCFSVWAKKGDQDHVCLENETIANGRAWFNVNTATAGTKEAGIISSYVEDWGDGWCRCVITFTGTAAAHTFTIRPAPADNDDTFPGDGATKNTYWFGAQCEIGTCATSYIPTVAAAATRLKDQLRYKGDDGNLGGVGSAQRGTFGADLLMVDHNNAGSHSLMSLSDGGAGADRINVQIQSTDSIRGRSEATAGNSGAATPAVDVTDGVVKPVRLRWATDNLVMTVGSTSATDTTADMPDDLDRIDIGQSISASSQLNGVISNIRFYKKPVTSG